MAKSITLASVVLSMVGIAACGYAGDMPSSVVQGCCFQQWVSGQSGGKDDRHEGDIQRIWGQHLSKRRPQLRRKRREKRGG